VIRAFGTPAALAAAHSPRETTFAPKRNRSAPPSVDRRQTARITAGTSFALTLYWRIQGSGNAVATSAAAASIAAASVT
jgi:hypothetical protein